MASLWMAEHLLKEVELSRYAREDRQHSRPEEQTQQIRHDRVVNGCLKRGMQLEVLNCRLAKSVPDA